MDRTEVTNEQFARFVKATGYVTVAERKPTREEFPDARRGEPEGRVRDLRPALGARGARRSLPVVDVPAGNQLAASRRSGEQPPREGEAIPSFTSPTKTPRPTRSGPASACRPRPSGSSRRAEDCRESPTRGATTSVRRGKWPANIYQGNFPVPSQDTAAGRLRRASRPSGAYRAQRLRPAGHRRQRLGVVQRLVPPGLLRHAGRAGATSREIRRARRRASIRPSPAKRSASTAAARSSAPSSTARATWSARAARAKCVPEATTSASGA